MQQELEQEKMLRSERQAADDKMRAEENELKTIEENEAQVFVTCVHSVGWAKGGMEPMSERGAWVTVGGLVFAAVCVSRGMGAFTC